MSVIIPRRGDVILVEQGVGIVRFVGKVEFDDGEHLGIELKGCNAQSGNDGSYNGKKYFSAQPKHGLFITNKDIIRTLKSEELLEKLAILYDILSGRTSNSNFINKQKYNDLLKENIKLKQSLNQQNILIQSLTKENEALNTIKTSSTSTIGSSTDISQSIDNVLNDDLNNKNRQSDDNNDNNDNDDDDNKSDYSSTYNDDDDDEPSPSQSPLSSDDDLDDNKWTMDQLSDVRFKCIQSSFATQAGTKNGKIKTNQDSYFVFDTFGPSSLFQLYGVCDGHGPDGHNVSKYVKDNLPKILNNLLTTSLSSLSISSILIKSFNILEKQLYSNKSDNIIDFDIDYSGTTATIGLLCGNKLYVANIGDSRTVLGRTPPINAKKKLVPISIPLSRDHDPKNVNEISRIKKSKSGKILFDDDNDARIQIELPQIAQDNHLLSLNNSSRRGHKRTGSTVKKISASVSRSIGDRIAHEYGGLISIPEITIHNIINDDIFIIFASDGIWTMIDNDDVMRVIGTNLNKNKDIKIYNDLNKITTRLVKEANISWQDEYEDYTDDITCVVTRIANIKNI